MCKDWTKTLCLKRSLCLCYLCWNASHGQRSKVSGNPRCYYLTACSISTFWLLFAFLPFWSGPSAHMDQIMAETFPMFHILLHLGSLLLKLLVLLQKCKKKKKPHEFCSSVKSAFMWQASQSDRAEHVLLAEGESGRSYTSLVKERAENRKSVKTIRTYKKKKNTISHHWHITLLMSAQRRFTSTLILTSYYCYYNYLINSHNNT